ncbi:8-oxo-dGTP diphosphatase [Bradyrhizobium macuxiense]|uniref:8-oxo-dGTP diphosphatase n=1 Tax=Bradyrhizobium macuxiense TaxID=1755647 RepID=A0A560L9C2_9BRAD|nr:NUDIX hydrolase [Bradyrhizobium macuxiense]TWB92123.1 8-oxo-dGTP diphosphatase [Bradyrhizobium macuxiense]
MARTPVLAAGGIVLRREAPPRFAVVRLRKRNEWVLPKGKLDDGETARAAAEREVLEETGHDVDVHEFLGTLVYDSGGRSKVVHYWRMDAGGKPVRELMSDVREVDWLPLDAALERLSRGYERAFLENVGPIALQAAANAERERRARLRVAAAERRRARLAAEELVAETPVDADMAAAAEMSVVAEEHIVTEVPAEAETPIVVDARSPVESPVMAEASELAEMPAVDAGPDRRTIAPEHSAVDGREAAATEPVVEAAASDASRSDAREIEPVAAAVQPIPRKNLIERVRDWLRRAA